MKIILVLFALSASCMVAALFANVAALLASNGSSWADPVGYTGLVLAAVLFLSATAYIVVSG